MFRIGKVRARMINNRLSEKAHVLMRRVVVGKQMEGMFPKNEEDVISGTEGEKKCYDLIGTFGYV